MNKKNLYLFAIFALISKLQLFIGLTFFQAVNENIAILLISLALQVVFLYIMITFSGNIKLRNFKFNAEQKIITLKNFIYLSIIISFGVYTITGFPLLAEDPNSSKVGLSAYAPLMRFVRVLLPVAIFSLSYIIFKNNYSIKEHKYTYLASAIILLLSGFKGYVFVYFFIPIIISLLISNTLNFSKNILAFVIFLLIGLISIVMIVESADLGSALEFLLFRLTYSQAEGAVYLIENLYSFKDYSYWKDTFLAPVSSILGFDYKNLNYLVFSEINNGNILGMQVSIPLFIELMVPFGFIGGLIYLFFETILIYIVLIIPFELRNFSSILIWYLSYQSFFDLISNGGGAGKILDYIYSIALIGSILLIYRLKIK